jgi:hypothetical protein
MDLRAIWRGTVSKQEHARYFAGAFSIYVVGAIIAAALYPGGFSFKDVYISYLGGSVVNPAGHLYYNVAELITGILLIPHFIFMYKSLRPRAQVFNFLAAIFGILGCLGFASLGIYFQGASPLGHQIATWIAFGGFGLSAFLMLLMFLRKRLAGDPWPRWRPFVLTYGQVFVILIVATLFTSYEHLFAAWDLDPGYFGDRFWEWFYMLIVVLWLIGILAMVEDNA